jgi:hypothetical protein
LKEESRSRFVNFDPKIVPKFTKNTVRGGGKNQRQMLGGDKPESIKKPERIEG